jgi:hypothetical protein
MYRVECYADLRRSVSVKGLSERADHARAADYELTEPGRAALSD